MKKLIILLFAIAGSTYFISCNKDTTNSTTGTGTSPFYVRMTDDPADIYDSVIVDVQSVEIKNDGGATIMLNANPGLYNLLDYANGNDTLIASADVPSVTVSQIRLILGPNNYVVVGGIRYPLKTPSAQQSGLKLNVHAALTPGVAYILKLDFDAARSIVVTGAGDYILKPVIRVVSTATGGSITGVISPLAALPATIFAIHSPDTLAGTTNAAGQFLIAGAPAGMYTVIVYPAPPFINDTIYNVNVSVNSLTDLDTVVVQ